MPLIRPVASAHLDALVLVVLLLHLSHSSVRASASASVRAASPRLTHVAFLSSSRPPPSRLHSSLNSSSLWSDAVGIAVAHTVFHEQSASSVTDVPAPPVASSVLAAATLATLGQADKETASASKPAAPVMALRFFVHLLCLLPRRRRPSRPHPAPCTLYNTCYTLPRAQL